MSQIRKRVIRPAAVSSPQSDRYPDLPLDPDSLECIELFALLLVRCNLPRTRIIQHFNACMEQLPREIRLPNGDEEDDPENRYVPAEVLTRWHLLPMYVGADGQPKALAFGGRGPSFTSLVHEVDRKADARQTLAYLLGIRAVTRIGHRIILRERKARHRLSGRMLRTFNFKATLALLRVAESNVREGRARQYQFTTDGSVPENRLANFRETITDIADQTLMSADEEMLRESRMIQRGRRAIPVTLGVFLSEGRPLPSLMVKQGITAKRSKPRGK